MKKIYLSFAISCFVLSSSYSQNGTFEASATTTMASTNVDCDGSVTGYFTGGTPPYTTLGQSTTDSINTFSGLCSGEYSLDITDANNNVANLTFTIGAIDTTQTSQKPSMEIVDSILKEAGNCDIDYSRVDSVKITSHKFISPDSVNVVWSVYQGATVNTQSVDYEFSVDGLHVIMVDLYCELRSVGSVRGIDQVYLDSTTDIKENSQNQLRIFPNPSQGLINIQADLGGTFYIVNDIGQQVSSFQFKDNTTLNLEHLSNGIYFIVGTNNGELTRQKVVILK